MTDLQVSAGEKFIFADDKGPIGSPTIDSMRTKVDSQTNSVPLITYRPNTTFVPPVVDSLNDFVLLAREANGGVETWCDIQILESE